MINHITLHHSLCQMKVGVRLPTHAVQHVQIQNSMSAPMVNLALPTCPAIQPLPDQFHLPQFLPHHRRINSAVVPWQMPRIIVGNPVLGENRIVAED